MFTCADKAAGGEAMIQVHRGSVEEGAGGPERAVGATALTQPAPALGRVCLKLDLNRLEIKIALEQARRETK